MLNSILQKSLSHILFVSIRASFFDRSSNMRVLWEDLLQQEFLSQGESFDLLNNHENKLRLFVKAYIVFTNERISLHIDAKLVLFLTQTLSHEIISNTDDALLNEIHLNYLILLVQNKSLFLRPVILSWSEAK